MFDRIILLLDIKLIKWISNHRISGCGS